MELTVPVKSNEGCVLVNIYSTVSFNVLLKYLTCVSNTFGVAWTGRQLIENIISQGRQILRPWGGDDILFMMGVDKKEHEIKWTFGGYDEDMAKLLEQTKITFNYPNRISPQTLNESTYKVTKEFSSKIIEDEHGMHSTTIKIQDPFLNDCVFNPFCVFVTFTVSHNENKVQTNILECVKSCMFSWDSGDPIAEYSSVKTLSLLGPMAMGHGVNTRPTLVHYFAKNEVLKSDSIVVSNIYDVKSLPANTTIHCWLLYN
jgi:hypothetical protein